ncbi:MAG: class I SAM-dependent methyltransferase [Spirochaetaceae bacterium]|nr:MAG: class I SAM-dependent methyltransferase [Spirochaetaceae bacterium]
MTPQRTGDIRTGDMSTLEFYDSHAHEIAPRYEETDFSALTDRIRDDIPPGSHILEVGSGSGRDGAAFLSKGFRFTAVDGSRAMIREAEERHPELRGRITHHVLPAPLPFADGSFDAAVSFAVLMHLAQSDAAECVADIARVIRSRGFFAYSVNTRRDGLDGAGRDAAGRFFTTLPAAQWESLHQAACFETIWRRETDDIVNRDGIRWVTFLARKTS